MNTIKSLRKGLYKWGLGDPTVMGITIGAIIIAILAIAYELSIR